MTTPTSTPAYVTLATAAAEAGTAAARLWGELESAERLASSSWSAVYHAARAAGDEATAGMAVAFSRDHWSRADRLAQAWHNRSRAAR